MFPTIPIITLQLFLFEIHRSSPPNERHKIKTISNAIVYNCFLGAVIGQWVADLAERGVLYCLWFQFILCRREHFHTQRCFGFSALIYWTTTLLPPHGSNKNNWGSLFAFSWPSSHKPWIHQGGFLIWFAEQSWLFWVFFSVSRQVRARKGHTLCNSVYRKIISVSLK